MKKPNLILLGPQGSGKGTQGKLLADYFDIPMIVTGDLYREQIRKKTPIGQLAEQKINKGLLMPDDITRDLLDEALARSGRKGVIIDGYPRNAEQAETLDSMIDIDYLIHLNISEEVTLERISNRRSCPDGHVYNLVSKPPKKDDICDYDGKKLFIRDDDKPESIKKRLEIFHKQTEPVIEHYKKKGELLEFDASGSIRDIDSDIKNRLKELD